MAIQWYFATWVVFVEIFFICLLLLPFVSARRWRSIFRSRLVANGTTLMEKYFSVMILVLLLLFGDALRNVYQYWKMSEHNTMDAMKPMAHNRVMKNLYKAHRNLLLSGMSLFLFVVLRRLTDIISEKAVLEADNAVSMMQAAAPDTDVDAENKIRELEARVVSLEDELTQTRDELEHAQEKLRKLPSETESGDSNDAEVEGFSLIKRK